MFFFYLFFYFCINENRCKINYFNTIKNIKEAKNQCVPFGERPIGKDKPFLNLYVLF